MFKLSILPLSLVSLICLSSHSVMAQDNKTPDTNTAKNAVQNPASKSSEKFPTIEEIDKLMSIHFPKEWQKKIDAQDKQKKLEEIAKTNNLNAGHKEPKVKPSKGNKTHQASAKGIQKPVGKDTIAVRVVTKGKSVQDRLMEQRASDIQKIGVNTKYSYNPKFYSLLPENIRNIRLMNRINRNGAGSLRLYRNSTDKALADGFFQYHQNHSQLLSAFLARKITLNDGVIGENVSLHKAFVDEMNYKFANTPVLSASSPQDAEEKYLYIQLRLTPADRVHFWKYINTMREGDVVKLPKGLTIADVLTADL